MPSGRRDTWLTVIVLAFAIPAAVIAGIAMFASIADTPLHTNPKDVPSVVRITPSPRWSTAVDQARQIARTLLAEQNLPGLSVAVGIGGDILWTEGFGWANLQTRVPVTPEMQFRIGHAAKPITAAAVGLLLEERRLDLDDEIQTYVPSFPLKKWRVTLRQLMAHVAGVRHYRDTEWGDQPTAHCERASEGLQTFANDPLLFEPGTQYRYSTYGWVLVSAAAEAAAHEPFVAFLRHRLFTPLGMTDTGPDSGGTPPPNRVMPYYGGFAGIKTATDVDYSCFAGAGGLVSTSSDLVRFGLAIQSGTLLQPATVTMLQTRQVLTSGDETDYGLGWMLETVSLDGRPTPMAGHGARTVLGGTTSLATFPERGLVVAVMANRSFADTKSIALRIAQAFAAESTPISKPR